MDELVESFAPVDMKASDLLRLVFLLVNNSNDELYSGNLFEN